MARIRTFKPDFFRSEDVASLPFRARLTWMGLWVQSDDHGRYKDSARLIKSDVWPLDDVSLRDVEEDLQILADQGRIVRYQVGGKRYLVTVNWHAHQSINRPGRPKYPAPPRPMASADPEHPNYCTTCAVSGDGSTPGTDRLAPAGQCAPEPREPIHSDTENSPKAHAHVSEDAVSTHGPLTPGRERKGKEGRGRAYAREEPPSPKCQAHKDVPDPPPCGACADARRARVDWDRRRAVEASDQQSDRAHQRALAVRAAIDACPACDARGYLPTGALCAHDPKSVNRSRAGMAAVRAEIRKPGGPAAARTA